jgi:hypothetical protein
MADPIGLVNLELKLTKQSADADERYPAGLEQGAQKPVCVSLSQPLGININAQRVVDLVVEGGQCDKLEVQLGSEIVSVGGKSMTGGTNTDVEREIESATESQKVC